MKKNILFLVAIATLAFACTKPTINSGVKNKGVQNPSIVGNGKGGQSLPLEDKPYLIMISADGFRHDYAKACNATTLLKLSNEYISADGLIPSFPSTTFANHYSIITGLYPSHHGIVDNFFL